MALPVKALAWAYSLCNRIAWTGSLNQMMGDVMYFIANHLINTRGMTCKGSSTGAAAGMDGVFRWTSGNDAKTRFNGAGGAQSWVAITLAGGRGDIVFSYDWGADDGYNIWWSPGGLATANATPTLEPSATDAITLTKVYNINPASIIGTTTAGDRLVSIWTTPGKDDFRVGIARAGTFESLWGLTRFQQDTYAAGITVADVTLFYLRGIWNGSQNGSGYNLVQGYGNNASSSVEQKRFLGRRMDGGGISLDFTHKLKMVGSSNNTATTPNPEFDVSIAPELQGGSSYIMKRWGLYSITAGARGDVGWLYDWYIGRQSVGHGDTAGTLEWICISPLASLWWPWDGATPVVMS